MVARLLQNAEEQGSNPRVRPVEEGGNFATKSKSTVWPTGPQHRVIKKLPGFPTHIGSPPPMLSAQTSPLNNEVVPSHQNCRASTATLGSRTWYQPSPFRKFLYTMQNITPSHSGCQLFSPLEVVYLGLPSSGKKIKSKRGGVGYLTLMLNLANVSILYFSVT